MYFENKDIRREKAKIHTKNMNEQYKKEIEYSIKNTKIYNIDFINKKGTKENNTMNIFVDDIDSISAIFEYDTKDKKAILNFASYKNPGGGFINGSKAQEECLCYNSFLYNVLKEYENTFYDWNRKHLNKSLYLNRALYSKDILFFETKTNKKTYCDVITCPAPNKKAAIEHGKFLEKENSKILESRIKFILDIAKENKVETLILGAFGCGVFGQDANEVSFIFNKLLNTSYKNLFKNVIFAIPMFNPKDSNYEIFKKNISFQNNLNLK